MNAASDAVNYNVNKSIYCEKNHLARNCTAIKNWLLCRELNVDPKHSTGPKVCEDIIDAVAKVNKRGRQDDHDCQKQIYITVNMLIKEIIKETGADIVLISEPYAHQQKST